MNMLTCSRTNCAHLILVILCAQLVRQLTANCAHRVNEVRAVRAPHWVKTPELTNCAHPPIPPRGACGQLAATPEPTARSKKVRARGSEMRAVRPATLGRVAAGSGSATTVPPSAVAAHGQASPNTARPRPVVGLWVSGQGAGGAAEGNRYSGEGVGSRGRREQPHYPTEFVSPVRSGLRHVARRLPVFAAGSVPGSPVHFTRCRQHGPTPATSADEVGPTFPFNHAWRHSS